MPSATRPDPPYLRIAAEIGARIRSGSLRPGERIPSIRQIADRWGVAVATATRAVAALREEGLVEAKVGSGTIVSASPRHPSPVATTTARAKRRPVGQASSSKQPLSRHHLLRSAIAIADVEGLDSVSMRRVAAELGVGPMSLYRHVANKDELVTQMTDQVFAEQQLPVPGPAGWRAKLELVSRLQWALCWQHPWLPRAVSFTRPLLVPNMMEHTEWTVRALDGLGLPLATRIQEALALHSLVVAIATSMANELEAEQETGVTHARWMATQRTRAAELFSSGRFPLLAEIHTNIVLDLDELFEYSLARHLDGFAALVREYAPARSMEP